MPEYLLHYSSDLLRLSQQMHKAPPTSKEQYTFKCVVYEHKIKPRDLCTMGKCSTTDLHPSSYRWPLLMLKTKNIKSNYAKC